MLLEAAITLATTRQAGLAIWACWVIPKNRPFILLSVDGYVREMYMLQFLLITKST